MLNVRKSIKYLGTNIISNIGTYSPCDSTPLNNDSIIDMIFNAFS